MAADAKTLNVTTPTDREIVMTRVFDAPRELVFEAHTSCEHLSRWWGPRKYETVFCEIDFRVGGTWRIVHRGPDGEIPGFHGEYLEIERPERFTWTFIWEGAGEGGPETFEFEEHDGKTTLTDGRGAGRGPRVRDGRWRRADLRPARRIPGRHAKAGRLRESPPQSDILTVPRDPADTIRVPWNTKEPIRPSTPAHHNAAGRGIGSLRMAGRGAGRRRGRWERGDARADPPRAAGSSGRRARPAPRGGGGPGSTSTSRAYRIGPRRSAATSSSRFRRAATCTSWGASCTTGPTRTRCASWRRSAV
jgi:uncharacterized protein YndB with AHSA1/START domain